MPALVGEAGLGLSGATAGQTFFTVSATGALAGRLVLKHGTQILVVVDDLGRILRPVSQVPDDLGRFLVTNSDGVTGYLDGGRFVFAKKGGLPSGYTRNADGTIKGPGNPGGQQALFRETGEVDASGRPILQRDSGSYFTIDADGKQQRVAAADLPPTLQSRGETPWQQSQAYIQQQVGGGEKSYLNGVEVPHGTPGSVRPDAVSGCGTQCFEVKNYDLSSTSGQNSLVNTTVTQINQRAAHLPTGMQQKIEIDISGQNVSRATREAIADRIVQQSNGAVRTDDINFFTRD